MAKNILVATPQPAFGELLRLSLEESGRYRVRLVQTGREALSSADHIFFSLAVLDAALVEPPLRFVALGLRKSQADIRLLVIPPAEGDSLSTDTAVQADGYVSQPFYAPNLVEMVDALISESPASPPATPPAAGPGESPVLQDASLATHQLEEFLKDSSAPGALLLRMQRPWAAAGQLNREAVNEVAGLLSRYTKANEGVDLARYVHLKSDGGEYLIYATPVTELQVLTLIYQVTTPLTVIRTQAARLGRLLRQAGAGFPASLVVASPEILTQVSAPQAPGLRENNRPVTPSISSNLSLQTTAPAVEPPEPETRLAPPPTTPEPRDGPPLAPPALSPDLPAIMPPEETDALMEAEAMRLADLLAAMPEPNPITRPKPEPGDWVQAIPAPSAEETGFLFPWELQDPNAPAAAAPPAGPVPAKVRPPGMETPPPPTPEIAEVLPPSAEPVEAPALASTLPASQSTGAPESMQPPESLPTTPVPVDLAPPPDLAPTRAIAARPLAENIEQTRPSAEQAAGDSTGPTLALHPLATDPGAATVQSAVSGPDVLSDLPSIEQTRPVLSRSPAPLPPIERGAPRPVQPAYTSVLLPLLPAHALEAGLAERLADWMPQLCLAYGWRLQGLLIRPDYLQWTVQIPPAVSPGNGVRLIRQQTSRRIFGQFPQLEMDNPSGDFWAPGYLIISGYQPPSLHLVQDFIRQTRLRQGAWSQ